MSGIAGVFLMPIERYQAGGVLGGVFGICGGAVGAVAKPLTGVVDFLSHLSIAAQVGLEGKKPEGRAQRVYCGGIIVPLPKDGEKDE